MPLDSSFDDAFKRRCLGWELRVSIIPRTCYYSGKKIWFKRGYRGIAIWTGPGDDIWEHRWVDRKEFLIQKLMGKI